MTKVSTHWADSRIREILLNEVYIGNMVQGRVKKVNYKSKKNVRLPKKEWKIIENTHEPIIDKATFLKAQEMIKTRNQTRIKTHDYLLKGLVYCNECGKKMGCCSRKLAKGNVYYLRCRTYTSYAKLGYCTSHSIRMDSVEKVVINKLKSIIQSFDKNLEMINLAKQKLAKQKLTKNKLEEYENKLSKITIEIDSMYNDKLNKILSEEDFTRIYERKKQEKQYLQNKINVIKTQANNNIGEKEIINNLINEFKSNLTINREILCSLVDKIKIDKNKKIYIYFKCKTIN